MDGVVCAEAEGFVFVAKGSDFGVVSGVKLDVETVGIGTEGPVSGLFAGSGIGFGAASQYGTLVGVVCAEAEGFVFVAKGSDFGVVSGVGTACGTVVIGTTWVWHL